MRARLGVLVVLVALALAVAAVAPAQAGGSPWKFDRDHYEPGEQAVAQTGVGTGCCGAGWLDDGPYFAWVYPWGHGGGGGYPSIPADALRVGEVEISQESYEYEGRTYSHDFATVSFVVPDLPPGPYALLHCNDPCAKVLGDITYGFFWVGVPGNLDDFTPTTTTSTTTTTTTSTTTTTVPPTTTTTAPQPDPRPPTTSTTAPLVAGGLAVAGVSVAGAWRWRRRRG